MFLLGNFVQSLSQVVTDRQVSHKTPRLVGYTVLFLNYNIELSADLLATLTRRRGGRSCHASLPAELRPNYDRLASYSPLTCQIWMVPSWCKETSVVPS